MSWGLLDYNDIRCEHGFYRKIGNRPALGCERCNWMITEHEFFDYAGRDLKRLVAERKVGQPIYPVNEDGYAEAPFKRPSFVFYDETANFTQEMFDLIQARIEGRSERGA